MDLETDFEKRPIQKAMCCMRKMLKIILKRACLGLLLGMAIGNIIVILVRYPEIVSPQLIVRMGNLQAALLIQILFTGVLGAFGFAGTIFFEIDE